MIKKAFLVCLLVVILFIIFCLGLIFYFKTDKPKGDPAAISIVHNQGAKPAEAKAKQWLKQTYQNTSLPSLSIAVSKEGDVLWQGVIGYADLKRKTLASPQTQYRIGSISKSLTAYAAVSLHQQGILDISQPFSTYVKGFGETSQHYSIQQLLSHQAGIRHYRGDWQEIFNTHEYTSTREAAAIVEGDALLFPPGEGFHYSTYAYTLAALAMASAYQGSFETLMQKEVFSPLAMQGSAFNTMAKREQRENLSKPYIEVDGYLFAMPDENVSHKYAGGGMLSTPSDLLNFGNALLHSPATALLWQAQALNNGQMNPQQYALGFRVGEDEFGRFAHHGGTILGGTAFLIIYPDISMVVAFAANVTPINFDRYQAAKALVALFVE